MLGFSIICYVKLYQKYSYALFKQWNNKFQSQLLSLEGKLLCKIQSDGREISSNL